MTSFPRDLGDKVASLLARILDLPGDDDATLDLRARAASFGSAGSVPPPPGPPPTIRTRMSSTGSDVVVVVN